MVHARHALIRRPSPLLADGGFAIGGHDAKSGDPFGMHAAAGERPPAVDPPALRHRLRRSDRLTVRQPVGKDLKCRGVQKFSTSMTVTVDAVVAGVWIAARWPLRHRRMLLGESPAWE